MKEIKVGDLVMVIRKTHKCRTPGESTIRFGKIFRVGRLWDKTVCIACKISCGELAAQPDDGEWIAYPLSWLIRIDPPAIPESITRDEGVTA